MRRPTPHPTPPKKMKRAALRKSAVLREPWQPEDAPATPEPSPSRVQARQRRIAELKEQAAANGTTAEMFPTAQPFNFGSIVASYPLNIVTPSTPSVIEDAPVQEGELATLAHEINKRLTLADRLDAQSQDHRLAAAIRLSEAKVLCEQKSMPFRKWAEAHIPHAFVTIRTLAKIGSAEDPKLALENYRTKNAEANRELRARKKAEVQALIEANPEVAAEIVAARPVVEPVRENGRFAGSVSLSPVEAMLREFDRLEQDQRVEFLKRAAEHLGALVEVPE